MMNAYDMAMATCAFCNQRKGKRTCPALHGSICSPCCGQHRLSKIDCPSDCIHLGGLSSARDVRPAFSKTELDSAFSKLLDYSRRVSPDPMVAELLGGEVDEWEMPIVVAFVAYGHRDAEGKRVVDRFIGARGRLLPAGEVAALVAIQQARASLFEVQEVQLGVGLQLHDLLTGEHFHVREVSATAQLKKWDVFFGWVMQVGDHLELTGACCGVPRSHLARVREVLDKELEQERLKHPGTTDRDLIGSIAWAPLVTLRAAVRERRMPQMRTTDDEELVFCKAHYAIRDREGVLARLAAIPDLESDDDGFTWINPAGNQHIGPGPVTLGRVHVNGDALVLETMSKERNTRGRAMLEGALGSMILHRADSIQDPEVAIEQYRSRGGSPKNHEVPEDIQRQVVGQYLRDYYARWLDEEIPALGGKSPREAVRTKRGEAQVEELLKELENGLSRQVGGDAVDISALRRELGLEDDSFDGPELYDANEEPDVERWLAIDESVRTAAVESHHSSLADHPDMPNRHVHALMHVIVENQLAINDPPEVRPTLKRLRAGGLTRHEAIHAIGSVVAEALFNVVKEGAEFDRGLAARALAKLRPDEWRFLPP